MSNDGAILVEKVPVSVGGDVVTVEVWHHASMNTDDERGYRLVRPDTGETREVRAPKVSTTPAGLRRRQLAERFVWGD